jgi:uncharacterized protein YuzE
MEAIKFFKNPKNLIADYDEEADALYLSAGKPRPGMGVDVGEGTVVRYNEKTKEVVGVTVVGLRARFLKEIKQTA